MSNKKSGQAGLFSFGFHKNSPQPEQTSSEPVATPAIKISSKPSGLTVNVTTKAAMASVEDNVVARRPKKWSSETYVPLAAPRPF